LAQEVRTALVALSACCDRLQTQPGDDLWPITMQEIAR
jgi:hypothetical protein